jgi:hypothetical protein
VQLGGRGLKAVSHTTVGIDADVGFHFSISVVPFLVDDISGSRAPDLFLVEEGVSRRARR